MVVLNSYSFQNMKAHAIYGELFFFSAIAVRYSQPVLLTVMCGPVKQSSTLHTQTLTLILFVQMESNE
jgi:hypothetical protein